MSNDIHHIAFPRNFCYKFGISIINNEAEKMFKRLILIASLITCWGRAEGILRDHKALLDCSQFGYKKVVDDGYGDSSTKSFSQLLERIENRMDEHDLHKVKTLDLSWQDISRRSVDQILTLVELLPNLKDLNLFKCNLSLNGVSKLLIKLQERTYVWERLKWVNVADNGVFKDDIPSLYSNLKHFSRKDRRKIIVIAPAFIDMWVLGDVFEEIIDEELFPSGWASYHREYYITHHKELKEEWDSSEGTSDFWEENREKLINFYYSQPVKIH